MEDVDALAVVGNTTAQLRNTADRLRRPLLADVSHATEVPLCLAYLSAIDEMTPAPMRCCFAMLCGENSARTLSSWIPLRFRRGASGPTRLGRRWRRLRLLSS